MAARWSVSHDGTYPGYVLAMAARTAARLDPCDALGERLRLVLLEGAGGLLVRDGLTRPFRAPSVLCLDEREAVSVVAAGGAPRSGAAPSPLTLRLLYFHPSVLHHELGFDRLRGPGREALPVPVSQDAYWLEPFVRRDAGWSGVLEPGPLAWKRLVGLHDRVADETAAFRDLSWPCRSRTYLIELLFFLTRLAAEAPAPSALLPPGVDPRVRELVLILHAHYDRTLTVAALARRLGTNRTSLQQRFQEATGKAIMEYLTGLRVEVAQGMLRDTLLPVSEIAGRTGYADAASFSRAFRKVAGATPTAYRDRAGWMKAG
jgi:AraC family L-rhamnose operon regulatory protein RhaS